MGNGRLAAMVFGDVRREHLQLNEDTVWSGEKRDRSNPEASRAFPEVRRLLLEGHPAQAQALADRTMISIPRALPVYQTLGDLWLDFNLASSTTSMPLTHAIPATGTKLSRIFPCALGRIAENVRSMGRPSPPASLMMSKSLSSATPLQYTSKTRLPSPPPPLLRFP